jgi:C-terminal processing protease CtpA/Prc
MIRHPGVFPVFLIAIVICQAGAQTQQVNFGFEQLQSDGHMPQGWFQWGAGYSLVPDSSVRHSGKYSIRIEPGKSAEENSFGCCARSIPATFGGKQIELRGYMKLQDVQNGFAGLLLRIDGEAGVLKGDNMQSRDIHGTSDWQQYSVQFPLPSEAKTVYVGAIFKGTGTVWVDDFQLLVDGKDFSEAAAKQLKTYKADLDKEFDDGSGITAIDSSPQMIEHLTILGRVWGYLKYYHPKIAEGEYNWDYQLFRTMRSILKVQTKQERNAVLSRWIGELGVPEEGGKRPDSDPAGIKLLPDLKWTENAAQLGEELVRQLKQIGAAKRTDQHYYIGQVLSVGNPVFKNEKSYSSMLYPDAGYRLLCLYRYWNIIQYFFPYKYLIGEDWNKVLPEFVPRFVNAKNELEYKLTLLELIARVHDTHANIWQQDKTLAGFKGRNYVPVKVGFVEDKAVIVDVLSDGPGQQATLKKGDVILSVNDQSIDAFVKARLPYTPASNYPTQLRTLAADLLRSNDSTIAVKCERDGKTNAVNVTCLPPERVNLAVAFQRRDTCWRFLKDDIGYIYPGTIKIDYLPKIMSAFEHTKGIVIDLRCYPSAFIVFALGQYLLPEAKEFVKFTAGDIKQPGLFTFGPTVKVGTGNPAYYKGKIIVLVNESTISQAEYTTMAFRAAPGTTVIGSTTSGADGNVSPISLPGGINTLISGIGVYYPDGRETQRIGIVPDIELQPTIKGIRENRDELLEKAIEVIRAGR